MNASNLKSMLAVAVTALFLVAPAAQAQDQPRNRPRDTGVGALIAAQGNAALRQIREELKFTLRADSAAGVPVASHDATAQAVSVQPRPKSTKAGA